MLLDFEKHIKLFLELTGAENINIACSGGVDSIVLVELMHRLNFPITVLHCNFQLRIDADADEEWLKSYCKSKSILFKSKVFNTPGILEKEKGGIQEIARNLRYNWFKEINEADNSPILIAHHEDDQIETFLQNLERGAGTLGLSSMLSVNGCFIRPLLPFSKEQILSFAIENEISWREDASNATNKYNRNFFRNVVIPVFTESSRKLILTLIKDFQKLNQVSQLLISKSIKDNTISIEIYTSLPFLYKQELCRVWNIPTSSVNELDKLSVANSGAKKEFGENVVWRERDMFLLEREEFIETQLTQTEVHLSEVDFRMEGAFIDSDKIKGDLILRAYNEGEYFSPLGMKGKRLVSNYLKDLKVLSSKKRKTLVVADDEKIVWIPIGAPSEKVKVSSFTKNVIWLSIAD